MIMHAVNKPHRKHIPHKRAAAITDKWERYAGDGQNLNRHSYVLKYMKGDHANDSRTHIGVK